MGTGPNSSRIVPSAVLQSLRFWSPLEDPILTKALSVKPVKVKKLPAVMNFPPERRALKSISLTTFPASAKAVLSTLVFIRMSVVNPCIVKLLVLSMAI